MAAEAEVDWERNSDLAAEETLYVFFVVMASCRWRGRGKNRCREEVAQEERKGEFVFLVEEGDFGECFDETAVCSANDEAVIYQFRKQFTEGDRICRAERTLWPPFLR